MIMNQAVADMYETIKKQYASLTKYFIANSLTVSTMESMTGGLIASLLTDTEGASAIMKGAFVTYSNEAKMKQGVPSATIDTYGVYSKETAFAMAKACRETYASDIGIGITGSASNIDLNNADSIPGIVYIAVVYEDGMIASEFKMPMYETRLEYKFCAAEYVYKMLTKIYTAIESE